MVRSVGSDTSFGFLTVKDALLACGEKRHAQWTVGLLTKSVEVVSAGLASIITSNKDFTAYMKLLLQKGLLRRNVVYKS